MTVSVQETRFPYLANGVSTVFAYGCQVLNASDLRVFFGDVEVTSGFSVAGIGAATGGTVTFAAAPPAGTAVTVERIMAFSRETDYQQNGDFKAKTVNPDFDRLWMALQQTGTILGMTPSAPHRALVIPRSDPAIPALPNKAARANKFLSFDSQGNPIASLPVLGDSAAGLRLDLLNTSDPNNGPALLGFVISQNVTLYVPGQYLSVAAAMAALKGRLILSTARVTIQLADGVLAPAEGASLNHINGEQIDIIGNRANPAACVVQPNGVAAFDLFSVSAGYRFGTVAGIRFNLAAKSAAATNFTAVLSVGGGSFVTVEDCQSNNWYYAYAARSGARMRTVRCTAENAGDVAFWAFTGAMLWAESCAVLSAGDVANNLGFGFMAEFGSTVEAANCTATGCYMSGFDARTNGMGRYYNCNSNANIGSGFSARSGGKIEVDPNSFSTNNGRFGIEVSEDGGVYGLRTAQNTGNAGGQANAFVYLSQAGGQAQIASSTGPIRIDASGSNSAFFNTGGGLQAEVRHMDGATSRLYLQGGGPTTAGQATVGVDGLANDIAMRHQSKGTGSHFFRTGTGVMGEVFNTVGATDWLGMTGGAGEGRIQATGASDVVHIYLAPKGGSGSVKVGNLGNYASDAAAAGGGVPISGLYRNGGALQVRLS